MAPIWVVLGQEGPGPLPPLHAWPGAAAISVGRRVLGLASATAAQNVHARTHAHTHTHTHVQPRVRCGGLLECSLPAYNLCAAQEPEKAVNAFVSAMEYNPKDAELILKVARALVTTHDYAGSIEYYTKVRPTGAAPPYICSDAMKTRGMAYIAQGCHESRGGMA